MSGQTHPTYHATHKYRQVQVNTSAKDDLLMLLLDGGVRFAEGGLYELNRGEEEDRGRRSEQLLKAQKIVLELISSLSPAIGLELYERLQGLYQFTFQRLFEGNAKSCPDLVGEGVTMMKRIRDLWKEAVQKAREEREKPLDGPRGNSSISVTG